MAEQTMIQVRMDTVLKDQAMEVFDKIGIDMSTAVRMFFKAAVREQRLPFSTLVADPINEQTKAQQLADYLKSMVMYEAPIADDEGTIAIMPLEYGGIPVAMYIQLLTKVPAGKITRWEDIFEHLGKLYGMKVYELPGKAMPQMDSDGNDIPFWRIVSTNGVLGGGRWNNREGQKEKLISEGIPVVQRGSIEGSYKVENYKDYLFDFSSLKVVNL